MYTASCVVVVTKRSAQNAFFFAAILHSFGRGRQTFARKRAKRLYVTIAVYAFGIQRKNPNV